MGTYRCNWRLRMNCINNSTSDTVEARNLHFFRSVRILCLCAFARFYVSYSLFPYSGFMILFFHSNASMSIDETTTESTLGSTTNTSESPLHTKHLGKEDVGGYAGILVASFMIGKALSAYPWGLIADRYGRRVVLIASCLLSAIGSLFFGFATSFWVAVLIRFLIGMGNGVMIVCRTAIYELAEGDKALESQGVGMLMSMVGVSMLISPALSGYLSDPYGHEDTDVEGDDYASVTVEQSLPVDLMYHSQSSFWGTFLGCYPFFLPNLLACVLSLVAAICVMEYLPESLISNTNNGVSSTQDPQIMTRSSKDDDGTAPTTERSVLIPVGDTKDSIKPHELRQSRVSASRSTILGNTTTRYYLMSYWWIAFVNVCQTEAFPLFAMSQVGGLGWNEAQIGLVGTLSGLVFCTSQYLSFTHSMQQWGFHTTLRIGAFLGHVPVILIPCSLLMTHNNFANDGMNAVIIEERGRCLQIIFLSLITGLMMVGNNIYLGCNMIGANESIQHSSQRAAMNGICGIGTSIARGLGPICIGFMMKFVMTAHTPLLDSQFGGWDIYTFLGFLGITAFATTIHIPTNRES